MIAKAMAVRKERLTLYPRLAYAAAAAPSTSAKIETDMSILGSRLPARWFPARWAGTAAGTARGVMLAGFVAAARAQAGQDPASIPFETGRVTVQGGIATIDLPSGWRYLQPQGARLITEQKWGNRPNPTTLGLLLPPTDWGGLIVSHDTRGYVLDDDADDIEPRAMLKTLRASVEAGNPARVRNGGRAVELLEWAQPPVFDPATRTLSWGRVLKVDGVQKPTLNYDIRVLSAEGTLVLQAVADYDRRAQVIADAHAVLGRIALAPGFRYADHDPLRHRRAGHGVRALVATNAPAAVSLPRLLVKPTLVLAVLAGAWWFRRRWRATTPI